MSARTEILRFAQNDERAGSKSRNDDFIIQNSLNLLNLISHNINHPEDSLL